MSCRELHEGLAKVGYKVNFGEDGSGFLFLALKRAGGYYLGTCSLLGFLGLVGLTVAIDGGVQTSARAR